MPLATSRLASLAYRTAATRSLAASLRSRHFPGQACFSGPGSPDQLREVAAGEVSDGSNARARSSAAPQKQLAKVALSRPYAGSRCLSTTADTTNIPDFGKAKHPSGGHNETTRAFTYLMVGATGVLSAVGAKSSVTTLLTTMSTPKDILALATIEVDLNKIPEGKNLILKWRGKPIFIRHRTPAEIEEANKVDLSVLRDKQTDAERTQDPAYLVMIGVCTHLGCVPIGEAGEYGGWFCPCHGSHYDISGRIRKGPAPLNLEIPPYNITADKTCVIG